MVPIPAIKYRTVRVVWYPDHLVEGALSGMGLARGGLVECLEINCPAWCPVLLWADHHGRAPQCWLSNWDRFQYTQPDVLVKLSFDISIPVYRYGSWLVGGYRVSVGVNVQL